MKKKNRANHRPKNQGDRITIPFDQRTTERLEGVEARTGASATYLVTSAVEALIDCYDRGNETLKFPLKMAGAHEGIAANYVEPESAVIEDQIKVEQDHPRFFRELEECYIPVPLADRVTERFRKAGVELEKDGWDRYIIALIRRDVGQP